METLVIIIKNCNYAPYARAVITKYPKLDGLNNRYLFLMVLEAGGPRSRGQQVWFLLRLLSLDHRQSPSPVSLHGLSSGHVHPWFSLCNQISFSYKDTDLIGVRPTLTASFSFNNFCEDIL